ncbi:MAG: aminomethyltransferase family protein [Acidimicrobiia bacterium]|nr:aminomethyltransferase family protein [Acidimicrobiia bacterium]
MARSGSFAENREYIRQVRSGVGILDIAGFSRYEVTGPDAAAWLDRLFAGALPAPGRIKLAPTLGHDGRLKGDLTLFNRGDGTWWIVGSYYLRQRHEEAGPPSKWKPPMRISALLRGSRRTPRPPPPV